MRQRPLVCLVLAALLAFAGTTLGADALDAWRENMSAPLARLVLQLLVVVGVARVLGGIARRVGQPSVVGEMAAGIALGPSLLGLLLPGAYATLFPPASLGPLELLSQIGVVLFMFGVGLDLNWRELRGQARAALWISHASIVVPFVLGLVAAIGLYGRYAPAGISFRAFGLFMGIAMSITAFPVLARMLEERGLTKTPIGSTALACAALNDVTAWTLLALVVASVAAGQAVATLLATLAAAAAFALLMLLVVGPRLLPLVQSRGEGGVFGRERLSLVTAIVFGSALLTQVIGLHALFGAFLAGLVMPADAEFRRGLRERTETFSSALLLPLFFAFTGLRIRLDLLSEVSAWVTCLVVILLATAGKLGGTALAARLVGLDWSRAVVLGALMNTRGLMELVALNVGYDLGVISADMFAILVLMALVTTGLTGPLLDVLLARQPSLAARTAAAVQASAAARSNPAR
jgi:Kef-type K+ transport system membrane component KefB